MRRRRQKVEELAALVEATRKRLKKKKAKRDAEKRAQDLEELSPDQYRMRWGICPDGYNWDPTEKTCEERDPEPGESVDKQTKDERDEEDRERQKRQDEEARRQAKEIEKEFGLDEPDEPDDDELELEEPERDDEPDEPEPEPDDDELELEEREPEPEPPPRIDEPEEPGDDVDVDDLEVDEPGDEGEEVDVDDLEVDEPGDEDDLADEGDEPAKPKEPEPPLPDDPKLAEQVKRRRERRKKLTDLFAKNPKAYEKETERMREAGELPDRETAKMLSRIKNIDELPDEVLKDKEKVQEIIRQQDEQREHEERMLKRMEEGLKAFDAKRKRMENAGRKPPDFEPTKFLRDLETMYDRPLPKRSEDLDKKLNERGDDFLRGAISGGQDRGSKSYWWKELFENLTRPLPKWRDSANAATEGQMMDTARVTDLGAEDGSWPERDRLLERMTREDELGVTAATSPGITNMEPREIGFPPYDRDRPARKHIPNEPSGRLAFPPYDGVETVDYKARDAKMQGFPPYDGKGEPHDTQTVGLPPYNKKAPHEGRGFPPYHDGESVYDHRRRTVDLATSPARKYGD